MRENFFSALYYFSSVVLLSSLVPLANADVSDLSVLKKTSKKDWTMLVYLNGNNSLDSFGEFNIKQMEKVGSTSHINVVVQWASLQRKKTERLLIQKSTDPNNVTSPVVQDIGNVDMGDWNTLADFIKWGVQNYPAQHYFIDVWDHGSGWHAIEALGLGLGKAKPKQFHTFDISWDDNTGHSISTLQLGQALDAAATVIGHKVDLYGSDACLMAMAEIADEVSKSVNVFAGSEEVEPGQGWPYDTLLQRWTALSKSTASDIGKILTEEYVKSYSGGENGNQEATFSALDLSKMVDVNLAMTQLGRNIANLSSADKAKVVQAAGQAQSFTDKDYVDLTDFLNSVDNAGVSMLDKTVTSEVRNVLGQFIIAHAATSTYTRAVGLSIWLPTTSDVYSNYSDLYGQLKFESDTQWSEALKSLY